MLPSPLLLTSTTPERFTSLEDCSQIPVGFVLEGKGLSEEPLVSNILYYYVRKDGTWAPAGAGVGTAEDLILPKNSDPATRPHGGTGSLPSPKETLDVEKCASEANAAVNTVLFDRVRFKIDDIEYDANFNRPPLTGTRGYYVRIERTY